MTKPPDRRSYPRIQCAFPVEIMDPREPLLENRLHDNLQITNISAGGLYCKIFRAPRLGIGNEVRLRILIPPALFDPPGRTVPEIFGPFLRGAATVVRIERVELVELSGWGVAFRFREPLDLTLRCER